MSYFWNLLYAVYVIYNELTHRSPTVGSLIASLTPVFGSTPGFSLSFSLVLVFFSTCFQCNNLLNLPKFHYSGRNWILALRIVILIKIDSASFYLFAT